MVDIATLASCNKIHYMCDTGASHRFWPMRGVSIVLIEVHNSTRTARIEIYATVQLKHQRLGHTGHKISNEPPKFKKFQDIRYFRT